MILFFIKLSNRRNFLQKKKMIKILLFNYSAIVAQNMLQLTFKKILSFKNNKMKLFNCIVRRFQNSSYIIIHKFIKNVQIYKIYSLYINVIKDELILCLLHTAWDFACAYMRLSFSFRSVWTEPTLGWAIKSYIWKHEQAFRKLFSNK